MKTFAWTADRLFDGQRVLVDRGVIVSGGKIRGIVRTQDVPDDIPLTGEPDTTILPGLIDTHTHFMSWQAPLFLAYGITTIRDTGNDLHWILKQREQAGRGVCPEIVAVGPLLDGPEPGHPLVSRACLDPDDAAAAVREIVEAGVDGVKLYCGIFPEWLPGMTEAAHRAGLKVSMHCHRRGVLPAIRAGVDEFFHLDGVVTDVWPDSPPGWLNLWGRPEFIKTRDAQLRLADEIKRSGMTATPTFAYWDSRRRGHDPDCNPKTISPHVPAEMIRWQTPTEKTRELSEEWGRALEEAQRFLGLLLDRDVPVLAGSDVPCGAVTPGLSLWHELSLLSEAGMTPLRALQAATSDAAAFLNRTDIGGLFDGARADMVIVRNNPIEIIPEDPEIVSVVHRGLVCKPSELMETAEKAAVSIRNDPWSEQFRRHSRREEQ